eukprot:scpid76729/ scgid4092/ 
MMHHPVFPEHWRRFSPMVCWHQYCICLCVCWLLLQANYWNITSGRYATTCSHSSLCSNMSAAVNKFPEGTFSPANFVKDLASRTGAKLPVFDLNVLTMDEGTWDMQINTLQPFCADVECFVEIGNELYLNKQYSWHFPDASTYMTQCKSLITKLRQRFPKVKISVPAGGIGSFIPKHLAADIGITMTQEEIGESCMLGSIIK